MISQPRRVLSPALACPQAVCLQTRPCSNGLHVTLTMAVATVAISPQHSTTSSLMVVWIRRQTTLTRAQGLDAAGRASHMVTTQPSCPPAMQCRLEMVVNARTRMRRAWRQPLRSMVLCLSASMRIHSTITRVASVSKATLALVHTINSITASSLLGTTSQDPHHTGR